MTSLALRSFTHRVVQAAAAAAAASFLPSFRPSFPFSLYFPYSTTNLFRVAPVSRKLPLRRIVVVGLAAIIIPLQERNYSEQCSGQCDKLLNATVLVNQSLIDRSWWQYCSVKPSVHTDCESGR